MKLHIGWDALIPVLFLVYGDLYILAAGYLVAVLVHEMGHLAAIRLMGGRVDLVHFGACGGVITYHGVYSYIGELVVALSGAAMNFAAAYILSAAAGCTDNYLLYTFSGINLTQGVFNLVPIFPLDGGTVMYTVLCMISSPYCADRVMKLLSFLISFVFIGLGVYILIKTRYNGTMLLCGCSLFLSSVWESGNLRRRKHIRKLLQSRG